MFDRTNGVMEISSMDNRNPDSSFDKIRKAPQSAVMELHQPRWLGSCGSPAVGIKPKGQLKMGPVGPKS